MDILVAGGAGYIGSKLVNSLNRRYPDKKIRVLDNMRRERYCSLWNFDPGVEFYHGDIREDKDVQKCLEDIDTVFCLADLTNAGKSFEREQETCEINFEGVKNLFDLASNKEVEKFIYTSSASVYGNTPNIVDESFNCDPISPYGREKLKVEKYLLEKTESISMKSTALRLGTVYGYSKGMRFDTVINYFTYLASQGKPLTVHKSALDEYRPYTSIKDVIRAYLFSRENIEEMDGEQYNVVGDNYQMEDVLEVIESVFPDVKTVLTENSTENKVSYQLSDVKMRDQGFETEHSMEDGVQRVKQKFEHLDNV